MMVKDFFELSEQERETLFAIHKKQKRIFDNSKRIKMELDALNQEYAKNQEDCAHPFPKKTHRADNDYGCATSYSTEFYCPDCDKRWFKEGSL